MAQTFMLLWTGKKFLASVQFDINRTWLGLRQTHEIVTDKP